MEHAPLMKPRPTRPVSQQLLSIRRKAWGLPMGLVSKIRDQLTISSWLALGACLQSLLFLVAGRVALVPAFVLIFYRVVDTALMVKGWKPDPDAMENILKNKYAVHYPDSQGKYSGKPANKDVVVFMIGARSNHPLGLLAPGFNTLGDYFDKMCEDVEARSEEYGLLGCTNYAVQGDCSTSTETMSVMFFENMEGLHKFAHDPLHREGWNWWNKDLAKFGHISIWHEAFHSPAGHWEGIYINSHPRGLAATTVPITLEKDSGDLKAGTKAYLSPIVDARKGVLKTSAGRFSVLESKADEHDKYGKDPYERYGNLTAV
ncbi:hypothetical protein IWX49DRAFT_18743 [Phyllosticta citricarpa]|uniref:Monooxygenase n=2 Tax=Phyllosticta TaxID=121621 RepID=A0ABR1MS98_9PEZI